ncbi:hypothetical protein [Aquariibacter albus]|uniref:FdhE central domain-containing protein n=1 Tax=Aquariibacter albus TaxID=2759899 RepID=A0A839HFF2_9BURK|nr:hypothetical protein [Aquariibacter albus]MBB1160535.1 hypothetical protein [Aquariibacter albus]
MSIAALHTHYDQPVRHCPVCGSEALQAWFHGDRHRLGLRHLRCTACGHGLQARFPSPQALNAFYERDYRRLYKKGGAVSLDEILTQQKFERGFGAGRFVAAHAGDAGFDVHVDFGASDGFAAAGFSRSVRARRTLGVEPDALSATLGREYLGVETVPDLAGARAELPAGARVLLTMNQVVEHLLDLRGPLDPGRLHGLDAWLYVEVPDAARYRRARDFHIAHLHHFSASSLRHLLEGLGWELLALDSYRPLRQPLSLRALARPRAAGQPLPAAPAPTPLPPLRHARIKYLLRGLLPGRA